MIRLLPLALLLLPVPALAASEQEAHDSYVTCFAKASIDLMPSWCHASDKLANFAHQSCLTEASEVLATARIRKPEKALLNAQLSGKLAMFSILRKYKTERGCDR